MVMKKIRALISRMGLIPSSPSTESCWFNVYLVDSNGGLSPASRVRFALFSDHTIRNVEDAWWMGLEGVPKGLVIIHTGRVLAASYVSNPVGLRPEDNIKIPAKGIRFKLNPALKTLRALLPEKTIKAITSSKEEEL